LTTSRRFRSTLDRLKVEYLLLPNSEDWKTQLCLVLRHFDLKPELKLDHCPLCVSPLRPADPDRVKERIPPKSYELGKNFKECPSCGRIYWIGSHKRLMEKTLEGLRRRCRKLFGLTSVGENVYSELNE